MLLSRTLPGSFCSVLVKPSTPTDRAGLQWPSRSISPCPIGPSGLNTRRSIGMTCWVARSVVCPSPLKTPHEVVEKTARRRSPGPRADVAARLERVHGSRALGELDDPVVVELFAAVGRLGLAGLDGELIHELVVEPRVVEEQFSIGHVFERGLKPVRQPRIKAKSGQVELESADAKFVGVRRGAASPVRSRTR